MRRMTLAAGGVLVGLLAGGAATDAGAQSPPRTLQDALAAAYSNAPVLQAARAQLRATDEGVAQALAGWRPQVVIAGGLGYGDGTVRQTSRGFALPNATGGTTVTGGGATVVGNERDIFNAQATLTQPLYRGGRTRAETNQADNRVFAQRGRLLATEQQVLNDTVNAYVGVIQAQQLNQLNQNNEQVLTRQLQATNDRFRVGEITRTDVAQAEARLAGARSQVQQSAGNLANARATYRRLVGEIPDRLVEPQPLRLPVRNPTEAAQLAAQNNPNVIAALFDVAAARDAVDVAFSQLMPQVSLQASGARSDNSTIAGQRSIGYQVLLNASVPLYQGGAEYSRVRQARQQSQQAQRALDDARRTAIGQATQAWETLTAARATADSTRSQIRANQIALEGVQREALVGSRTTLDVLNAEQELLNSRVTLVQNLASLITASYSVASALGRLTARDLNLGVPIYDETAYYNAVRERLFGTGDYATSQPGR